MDELEPAREEDDRPEEAEADQERRQERCGVGPVPEHVERDDRFLGSGLDGQEQRAQDRGGGDQTAHLQVGPIARLLVGQRDQQGADGHDEDGRTGDVEVARRAGSLDRWQQSRQDDQADDADRDVDVEDPVPAHVVGEQPAEGGSDDERDTEDRTEQALVAPSFGRCVQVTNDRERDREERSRAKSLDASEQDQHAHVLRQAGQRRADQEDGHPDHHHRLAPVQVGQLAVERHRDGGRQEVDRDDPGVILVTAQIGHDPGQRRSDDGLVERAEEEGEQDGAQDLELGSRAQAEGRVVSERWGGLAVGLRRE